MLAQSLYAPGRIMSVDVRSRSSALIALSARDGRTGPGPVQRRHPLHHHQHPGLGLLDVLVPLFEKKTGLTVKTISVGTGQALALAARGEADVTLAHAPSLEKKYVAEGKMTQPPPGHVQRLRDHRAARRSREDQGLAEGARRAQAHRGEPVALRLARATSRAPTCSSWPCGSRRASSPRAPGTSSPVRGWAQTLGIANDRRAYTLTDRGDLPRVPASGWTCPSWSRRTARC